ncbi:MAG: molecular chaperone TorD [Tardiphaga sp.]|uniref:TorD/DmsD family molecular chaperone n=1 Tax=Tardiphaga sp. TaxID=1926292 RepID=UPI002632CDCC|nr:molecular chaperone TorD family protein [Tardiphaga sp.]MDB5500700.1 molecular chaperone TorD [Tardiphaga sp.]
MNSEPDIIDELDHARAQEYALLATLLVRNPDADVLRRLALLGGDDSPLGAAHAALGVAAASASAETVRREYFDLFAGLGENGLMPYASFYLSGSLYGRPLARLRNTLQDLGIERVAQSEPEDHAAVVCEIMAGLTGGAIPAPAGTDRAFFKAHVGSWIRLFFADLEKSNATAFYTHVGAFGRVFIDIETEAFAFAN